MNCIKKTGIVVDDNWFQEVTESAEDTVREFLEVSKQVKDKHKENSLLEQEVDKSSLHYQKTVQKLMNMILITLAR